MSMTPDLVAIWTRGWALTRGAAPPVWDDGWRIEVGAPDQVRRFVFAEMDPAVVRHAEAIDQAAVFLKVCAPPDDVRRLVPERWSVAQTGWAMSLDGIMSSASPVDGYEVRLDRRGGVAFCTLVDADGAEAARGRAVTVGDHVIYDRIAVEPAHQRRGLGGSVMRMLESDASEQGRGLLVATDAGRALYETLGWRTLSPYTTAFIP